MSLIAYTDEQVIARFFLKTRKTATCWLWEGRLSAKGYSMIRSNGRSVYGHRLAYKIFRGAIPHDQVIDHRCRVRNCVNPRHLRIVTLAQNVMCGEGACAKNARKTHCKNGHEFTKGNTYFGNKRRECAVCARKRRNEHRRKFGRKD